MGRCDPRKGVFSKFTFLLKVRWQMPIRRLSDWHVRLFSTDFSYTGFDGLNSVADPLDSCARRRGGEERRRMIYSWDSFSESLFWFIWPILKPIKMGENDSLMSLVYHGGGFLHYYGQLWMDCGWERRIFVESCPIFSCTYQPWLPL